MKTSQKKKIFFAIVFVFLFSIDLPHSANAQTSIPTSVQQACDKLNGFGLLGSGTVTASADGTSFNCKLLNGFVIGINPDGTLPGSVGASLPTGGTLNIKGNVSSSGANCSLFAPGEWFNSCIWYPLMTALGTLFLSIGGFFLWVMGSIFDLLVQHVIIGFGQTLNDMHITGAVNTGWTVFRDVANIVLIGLFVFIAISIILGVRTFGDKKLIARVIIVAVLLNFSLLFTKMIIDFSNFTAYQFYSASALPYQGTNTNFDIAGAFMKPMGITSLWDTQGLVQSASVVNGDSGPSGWKAFFYGLVAGVMLLGVAAVLAYGSFQIASRAIALIFLMITASVAFVTFLLPTIANGEYGWKRWWGTLLNAAIFAPLLMVFLFISLTIVKAAGTIAGQGGLQDFANNPSVVLANNTWQVIFTYALVVGLLFVSIKISSKVASGVGGNLMGGLGGIVGTFATGGLGLASRFAAAPLARTVIGGAAYRAGQRFEESGKQEAARATNLRTRATELAAAGYQSQADKKLREAQAADAKAISRGRFSKRLGKVADSRMNVMDTGVAGTVAKAAGVSLKMVQTPKTTASYAKATKEAGAEAAKIAESIRPNIDEMKRQSEDQIRNSNKNAIAQKEQAAAIARDEANRQQTFVDAARKKQTEAELVRDNALVAAAKNSNDPRYADDKRDIDTKPIAETIRQAYQQQINNVDNSGGQRDRLEETLGKLDVHSSDHMKAFREEVLAALPEASRQSAGTALAKAESDNQSSLRHESAKIATARANIIRLAQADNTIKTDPDIITKTRDVDVARTSVQQAEQSLRTARATESRLQTESTAFKTEVDNLAKEAAKRVGTMVDAEMPILAEQAALQGRGLGKKLFGAVTKYDNDVQKAAVGALKRQAEIRRARDIITAAAEQANNPPPPTT